MSTPKKDATTIQSSAILLERLSSVLPRAYKFGVYHLSTPPTKTDALCSAPPDERPDKTFCENHFLAISIDPRASQDKVVDEDSSLQRQVLVLALEVFIFTTAYSSTFFVSKADSTGYLHLLNLPKGTRSPIKEVSSAFVSYLLEQRRRKDVQCVVSLFARAQDQYLFPGSVENSGKHVLDDRGLVKWWCKVLNPLVESPPVGVGPDWGSVKAYLVVPGLDTYETRAFLPRTSNSVANWVLSHPLDKISHYTQEYDWVPARCLIPRYPDDPKSRFRDELDEEAAKSKLLQASGSWKSVTTVDQFWEMMAFRQECSSGRLTGFIWAVFDPKIQSRRNSQATNSTTLPTPNASFNASTIMEAPTTPPRREVAAATPYSTPRKLFPQSPSATGTPSRIRSKSVEKKNKKKKALTGAIKPRQAQVKTQQRNYLLDKPVASAYYYWPAEGRGQRIVAESDYKRAVELLLRLDFANLDIATGSTRRWISEVGMGEKWGHEVIGDGDIPAPISNGTAATVNNISGLVKRKRSESTIPQGMEEQPSKVNVLATGLVRKKPKDTLVDVPENGISADSDAPKVNILSAGLLRKKPKAQ